MEFEYAQPEKGQEDYLRHLASQDILSRMGLDNINCVAAIANENGVRMPVGLMMGRWEAETNTAVLLWLYVEEDYREMEIAKNLLRMFFRAARNIRAKKICTKFYPEFAGESESLEMIAFLKKSGFKPEERENGPWMISGRAILEEDFIIKSRIKAKRAKEITTPIKELSMVELGRCMVELAEGESYPRLFADTEVSCVVRDADGWKGILVVCRYGNVYEPAIFHAINRRVEMDILVGMANTLSAKIGSKDYFRVKDKPERFAEWMDRIFPNLKRQKIIVAEAYI